jgi:hypothetical protein
MRVCKEEILKDFEKVINRNSRENESNTPDFLLAEYLMGCLEAYERIHAANEKWYGKTLEIGSEQFISWEALTSQKHRKTPEEKTIMACIAALSGSSAYQTYTPWEIYTEMVKWAIDMHRDEPDIPDEVAIIAHHGLTGE